jgi:flagellar motor protein MotB
MIGVRRPASQASWMITFADLLGLMLCFFVMVYASRAVPERQWDDMREQVAGQFNQPTTLIGSTAQPVEDEGLYLETWLQARIAEQPELNGVLVERTDRGISLRLSRSMELTVTASKLLVGVVERVDHPLLLVLPAGTVDDLNSAAEKARTFKSALVAAGLKQQVDIVLDPLSTDPALVLSLEQGRP